MTIHSLLVKRLRSIWTGCIYYLGALMKQKKCRNCKEKFTYYNSTQIACSPKCALDIVKQDKDKKFRKQTREMKQRLKTKSDWLREAQTACNEFIRLSDASGVCISCQNPPKKRNAGHYRSVGAEPALRFHPLNIHLQCEHCNSWKSGNATEYRIHLVRKIGVDMVEWLEGPHEAQKWSINDIKEIKAYYKEKVKELKDG